MMKLTLAIVAMLLIPAAVFSQPRPVANAGPDTAIYFPQKIIALAPGPCSGIGLKYTWTVYKTPVIQQSDSIMTFKLYDSAVWTFRLMVTDAYGRKDYDYVNVTAYWNPMTVSNILKITSVQQPAEVKTIAITNDGRIYDVFEKQRP